MSEIYTDFVFNKHAYIDDIEIPGHYIESVLIKKDFLNYRFPVILLYLNLPQAEHHKILEKVDYSNSLIEVELEIEYKISDNKDDEGQEYLDDEFLGVLDNTLSSFDPYTSGEYKAEKHSEVSDVSEEMTIALFRENDINAFKHGYINAVLKDFDLKQAILYGFQETTNGGLDLYMSPPDNEDVYEQDLITPMGFLQYLKYLDREMGIYDTSYNVYIEEGEVYILNKKTVHGIEPEESIPNELGSYFDGEIEVELIKDSEIEKLEGLELDDPLYYYMMERGSIFNHIELSKLGNIEELYSSKDDFEFDNNIYDGINTVNIRSNRFEKHRKKKYDSENWILKITHLPFKAKPYTDISISGEHINNSYRIVGYDTAISGDRIHNKVYVKRTEE